MAMTYYAVTDDPNELAHYGILGMKWGVRKESPRHSGSRRPRSAAYKKAQSKLGKMMKSGIKKAQANWRAYNSPAAKYERQTNRAIEKARKGKLKYGNLTDDQVRRVTERLAMERNARMLSDSEKTFMRRLGQSVGQGIITGVGTGVGSIVSEKIGRGSKLKTKQLELEQQRRFDIDKEQRIIRNAQKTEKKKYKLERKREKERARNAYDYGAAYTNDGKLDMSKPERIEEYYRRRYLEGGETRSDSYKRQKRELAATQRKEERARRKSEAAMQRATNIAVQNAMSDATSGYGEDWNVFAHRVGRNVRRRSSGKRFAGGS